VFSEVVTGLNRDVSSFAATSAISSLAVLLAVSVPIARVLAHRSRDRSAIEWFAGLAAAAPIVAFTLLRGEVPGEFDVGGLFDWSAGAFSYLSRDPLSSSQFQLNVALFVPAGVVWYCLTRRTGRTWAALVLASLLIECIQALTDIGANDLVDLVANSVGALAGVGSGFIVVAVVGDQRREISQRRRFQLVAALIAVIALISVGAFVGASRRQAHVRAVLEERFRGTDWTEVNELIAADFESVLHAVDGVRADGRAGSDQIVLRYPATFFGLDRCVYVTWTPQAMEIRSATGGECTRFIG
jgi:membrane-associated protease RseP (regulator of RpoE activity)